MAATPTTTHLDLAGRIDDIACADLAGAPSDTSAPYGIAASAWTASAFAELDRRTEVCAVEDHRAASAAGEERRRAREAARIRLDAAEQAADAASAPDVDVDRRVADARAAIAEAAQRSDEATRADFARVAAVWDARALQVAMLRDRFSAPASTVAFERPPPFGPSFSEAPDGKLGERIPQEAGQGEAAARQAARAVLASRLQELAGAAEQRRPDNARAGPTAPAAGRGKQAEEEAAEQRREATVREVVAKGEAEVRAVAAWERAMKRAAEIATARHGPIGGKPNPDEPSAPEPQLAAMRADRDRNRGTAKVSVQFERDKGGAGGKPAPRREPAVPRSRPAPMPPSADEKPTHD